MICNVCGVKIQEISNTIWGSDLHNSILKGLTFSDTIIKQTDFVLSWMRFYNEQILHNKIITIMLHHHPDIYNKLIKLILLA
jgi:hypothetical protein